jgi:hypothetical protein
LCFAINGAEYNITIMDGGLYYLDHRRRKMRNKRKYAQKENKRRAHTRKRNRRIKEISIAHKKNMRRKR